MISRCSFLDHPLFHDRARSFDAPTQGCQHLMLLKTLLCLSCPEFNLGLLPLMGSIADIAFYRSGFVIEFILQVHVLLSRKSTL